MDKMPITLEAVYAHKCQQFNKQNKNIKYREDSNTNLLL